ncbi:hypothetical protein DFH08DRAFT_805988 [Mycena albidolilacea]|uniref:Uncharacterized protein n=1 Tax=Mycena albidolilacea TaxID=1033008 RepID=A0AAD7A7B3_9AGAR|nr:hypothetical protein DFH08DRAFT_805988 [Mycena albidolilacea]
MATGTGGNPRHDSDCADSQFARIAAMGLVENPEIFVKTPGAHLNVLSRKNLSIQPIYRRVEVEAKHEKEFDGSSLKCSLVLRCPQVLRGSLLDFREIDVWVDSIVKVIVNAVYMNRKLKILFGTAQLYRAIRPAALHAALNFAASKELELKYSFTILAWSTPLAAIVQPGLDPTLTCSHNVLFLTRHHCLPLMAVWHVLIAGLLMRGYHARIGHSTSSLVGDLDLWLQHFAKLMTL